MRVDVQQTCETIINIQLILYMFKIYESALELMKVHDIWRSNDSENLNSFQFSSTLMLV